MISFIMVNESAVWLLTKGRKARLKYTSEWGKHKSTGETHEVTAGREAGRAHSVMKQTKR